jgi:hypothetical protein|eukprot:COSAG01_NODE_3014_length_6720_cov_157.743845_8_plen_126_part_00
MVLGGAADGSCLDFSSYEWPMSLLGPLMPLGLLLVMLAIYIGFYIVKLGSDTEPVTPIEPDLTKIGIAPALNCPCTLACFAKPEEYVHTWCVITSQEVMGRRPHKLWHPVLRLASERAGCAQVLD